MSWNSQYQYGNYRERSPRRWNNSNTSSSSSWNQNEEYKTHTDNHNPQDWNDWEPNPWYANEAHKSSWKPEQDKGPVLPVAMQTMTPKKNAYSLDSWISPVYHHSQVPSDFVPDDQHLDSRLDRGLPLLKCVAHTETTVARNIAGMSIESIPLINVIYEGYKNWCLRHLVLGRPTFFVMCKTFDKSCLLYSILTGLRDEGMQQVAETWNNKQAAPMPAIKEEDRRKVLNKYGEFVAKCIIEGSLNQDKALFDRVQELEKSLTEAKHRINTDARASTAASVMGKYARSKPDKLLHTDCPTSSAIKDVNAWAEKYVGTGKKKKLTQTVTELKTHAEEQIPQEQARQETILMTLIDHGMPIKYAGKLDKDMAYKILAAVHMKETA